MLPKHPRAAKETGGQKRDTHQSHTTGVTAKRLADTSAYHGRRNGDGKRRSKPLANHDRDGNFRHLLLVPGRVSVKLSSDKAPAVTSVTSQGAGGAATSTGGYGRVASVVRCCPSRERLRRAGWSPWLQLTGVGAEFRGDGGAEYTMTVEKGGGVVG